jgi:RNA polymerase sigma-70 factor (ECF subfamily)
METLTLDKESSDWLRHLQDDGAAREAAIARLHALMLRVARGEATRRRRTLPNRAVEELDDVCSQAANDALMAVLAKLDTFRGTARFTTWASKFAILETSARLRRHAWRHRKIEADETIWDRLPDSATPTLQRLEDEQLIIALQHAVRDRLTERQRMIFQNVTIDDVPTDVLAERLGTTRGAIYKTLHDARSKLRQALIDAGHGDRLP